MKNSIEYYDLNALDYINKTKDADMNAIHTAFLALIQNRNTSNSTSEISILDFGCGSGRDTKYFLSQGYDVDAVDGSSELVKLAKEYTGVDVINSKFEDFIATRNYDGIFACASLLHLEDSSIVRVLQELSDHLQKNGVMYVSFKYGDSERNVDGRYFNDFTEEKLMKLLEEVDGLKVHSSFVSGDTLMTKRSDRWLNAFLVHGDSYVG